MATRLVAAVNPSKGARAVGLLLAVLLAALLAASAVAKALSIGQLEHVIYRARLLPGWLVPYLAIGIPAAELCLAVAICIPRSRRLALRGTVVLMSVFVAYNAWRLWQNVPVPCICFGEIYKTTPAASLGFSIITLLTSQVARKLEEL